MIEESTFGSVEFKGGGEYPVCLMTYSLGDTQKTFELTLPIQQDRLPGKTATLKCTSPDLRDTEWTLTITSTSKHVGDADHLRVTARGTLVKGKCQPVRVRHGAACEEALGGS